MVGLRVSRRRSAVLVLLTAVAAAVAGCGAKSGLIAPDIRDGSVASDVRFDVPRDVADASDATDARDAADVPDACVPVADRCGPAEICGNGLNDNCDPMGLVDEGCTCTPGMVQACFRGPPGRRNVGACRDGAQVCVGEGAWGPCVGGIVPREDVCNGTDNLCSGCSERRDCPILCPGAGDPRVPDGVPFREYPLRGGEFYEGIARAWRWRVEGGPCDRLATGAPPSFELRSPNSQNAVFVPRLSGDYTVTLTVVTAMGTELSCTWIVHVEGPGLRVEMCYPESLAEDLDLFVHRPGNTEPWYLPPVDVFRPSRNTCGWHNCEAVIRGEDAPMVPIPRADWGYMRSPLAECENGPHGTNWRALGFCANPRLDIDNNLTKARGVPENINIDQPRDGESFRIMVQNFTGARTRPLVNIYCSGRRVATFGAAPDEVPGFAQLRRGNDDVGAMWRVADVRTRREASGRTACDVTALHPPGTTRGYWVTFSDPRF